MIFLTLNVIYVTAVMENYNIVAADALVPSRHQGIRNHNVVCHLYTILQWLKFVVPYWLCLWNSYYIRSADCMAPRSTSWAQVHS